MTSERRFLLWLGVVIACVAAGGIVSVRTRLLQPRPKPAPRPAAIEGTGEDPGARARWLWMQLRDPNTGMIPSDIGTRENAFAQRLALEAGAMALPVGRQWTSRGPMNIGGRTKALALDVLNETVILAGGVSSGMWKSTNGGTSWRKTTAPDQLHSVSCIAQNTAPGREHIWYYGTGEGSPNSRGGSAAGPAGTNASYRGDGIFKSTDGGESWSLLPSTTFGAPTTTDPFDFVWGLATFGTDGLYAATSTGLWRSFDGGGSWEHVLNFGTNYPSTEVALAANGTVWATIGGDGPDAAIYRSADGTHWDKLTPPGWPAKTLRTAIGLVPTNLNKVFFWTAADNPDNYYETHLFRYIEGSGWTDLRPNMLWGGDIATYGANMLVLKVKPNDENTIFLGAINLHRTTDGGQSFEVVDDLNHQGVWHVDQHSLVFYPSNPRRMLVGNDGGVFRTEDNMTNLGEYQQVAWQSLDNGYRTTQFYTVAIDHGTPGSAMVAGGMQDNGCMYTTSANSDAPWKMYVWGDGGYMSITNGAQYVYTSLGASLGVYRNTFVNGVLQTTEVTPTDGWMGLWMNPMILDPHDTRIMYFPDRYYLWRNSDLTQIPYVFPPQRTSVNWTKLTNVTQLISALGMSEALPSRLYYGTPGVTGWGVYRLDDPQSGQPVPVALSTEGLPPYTYVGCIAVDPRNVDKVIVVFPNYGVISVFSSEDGGQSWKPVAGNLEEHPDGSGAGPSVRWVAILYVHDHPVYFAGTSVGLFSTTKLDGMNTSWIQEGASTIGHVVVDMIDVRQSDGYVAVGTHGNGVYTTTVTELPGPIVRRHLFRPRH